MFDIENYLFVYRECVYFYIDYLFIVILYFICILVVCFYIYIYVFLFIKIMFNDFII